VFVSIKTVNLSDSGSMPDETQNDTTGIPVTARPVSVFATLTTRKPQTKTILTAY
jgi:hypothetical protein